MANAPCWWPNAVVALDRDDVFTLLFGVFLQSRCSEQQCQKAYPEGISHVTGFTALLRARKAAAPQVTTVYFHHRFRHRNWYMYCTSTYLLVRSPLQGAHQSIDFLKIHLLPGQKLARQFRFRCLRNRTYTFYPYFHVSATESHILINVLYRHIVSTSTFNFSWLHQRYVT